MATLIAEGTGLLIENVAFTDLEFERRLEAVRGGMSEQELDALVCFAPENLYYLTGHDTPGYYFLQTCVVTHDELPVNVIRALEATNTLGRSWSRRVVPYLDVDDPVEMTLSLLAELRVADKRVGAEADSFFVTPLQYERLRRGIKRLGGTLVDACGIVERARIVKSDEELVCVRRGVPAVEAAMAAAIEASGEGVTEREVASKAIASLVAHGSEYTGLPPFFPSGPRATLAHSTWSDRRHQRGDYLWFEIAANINRYSCALQRSGTVGPATDAFTRRMDASTQALENIIAAIRPRITAGDVFAAGNEAFVEAGFDDGMGRRLGYALGVNYPPDWGEGHIIDLREGSEKELQAGMVFHTTPGLIEYGKGVVAISETVIVTEDGCEVVTGFPRQGFAV